MTTTLRSIAVPLVLLFSFAVFSCVPNEKVIYLQNLEGKEEIPDETMIQYERPEYRLQYNDIIDIQVMTAEDLIEFGFNSSNSTSSSSMMMGQIAQTGGDIYYMTGYTVDDRGNVRIPIIGELNVMNLTVDEVRVKVQEKLKSYLSSEYYVRVKLGGIRFSAIGEFRHPGKYVVLQDRMTIFEAIAQAGDLSTVAKRDEVLLIRQYPDGTKLHRINLNDRHIIESPYYFIQPNDQIYAEPMKVREIGSGVNATQTLTLITSSITALALLLNLFN
ncbi:sugar transporter [Echinicola strongylocentroti]|uniref:Sugar transporter n=1 Tax=Echinicola strongylocentroti TaxID=1795355 RepID=A0A2Z4IEH2_9BACT|nr:polysaccharide biosynthesis/export family protein [Echinicola strongylocentroti]AWW29067.1 sugar transporter [Echinicola strongylocentroti]